MTEKQLITHLTKTNHILERQLNLAKKTILAFYDVHEGHRKGHNIDEKTLIALFQKCEDEMDLDN